MNELGIGKISTSLPPPPISQPDKPYPFQRPDFRELRFSDSIPPPRKDYLFTDILRVGALTIGNKLHGEHGETETAASYFSGTRITARLKRINPFRFRVASKNGEEGQDRIRVTKDCIESLPTSVDVARHSCNEPLIKRHFDSVQQLSSRDRERR